jgi:hypothetical protein
MVREIATHSGRKLCLSQRKIFVNHFEELRMDRECCECCASLAASPAARVDMDDRVTSFGNAFRVLVACLCVLVILSSSCGEDACGDNVCAETESPRSCAEDCDYDVVVVVEEAIREELEESLQTYLDGLALEGYRGLVRGFEPLPVSELRYLLLDEYLRHNIEGALLVGDLPVAWYEQLAWHWETFPTDVYLQDLNAVFYDDGYEERVFDRHTPLSLEIFTARLEADVPTLQKYFERVTRFRRSGPLLDQRALVFIDDDFQYLAGYHGLDAIYKSVTVVSDPNETWRQDYIDLLTERDFEFVFQAIHSFDDMLKFENLVSQGLGAEEIRGMALRASFVHMWNCWAANFKEPNNLATFYALENEYGLAVIGSTKKGAMHFDSIGIFDNALAQSQTLGAAFQTWYNTYGRTNDKWSLGMVLIGDPMLTVWGDVTGMTALRLSTVGDPEEIERWEQILMDTPVPPNLGTFEDYRRDHPEFFPD